MKLINLSFICALIFMIGSFILINAEPYPKLNFEKPFHEKLRRLACSSSSSNNMLYLKYDSDITIKFNAQGLFSPQKNTLLKIGKQFIFKDTSCYYVNRQKYLNQCDGTNYAKIIYIKFSNYKVTSSFLNTLFFGCTKVEQAFLAYLCDEKMGDFDTIFGSLTNLTILEISGIEFTGNGPSASKYEKLKYLDIKGATLSDKFKKDFIDNYDNLTICQDLPSLIKNNYFTYACCDYINKNNIKDAKCKPYDFYNNMKIYVKDNISSFDFTNYPKDDIRFVLSGNNLYSKEQLGSSTQVSSEFIIFFLNPLTTLEGFFEGEKKIQSIDLSRFNFSSVVSAKRMFKDSSLEKIDLSKLNFPELTTMDSMFKGSSLKTISLSNKNLPKLTSMASMFENTPLEEIDLSNLNFPELTIMESMFKGSSLKTISLSNTNLPKLTTMASMFENTPLKEINITDLDLSKLTTMESMFKESSLNQITLSNNNLTELTSMASMFENTPLEEIDLSNLNFPELTIMDSMFKGSSLKTISLSNTNLPKLTTMASMFENTPLEEINITGLDLPKLTTMESMFKESSLKMIDLSKINLPEVTIMASMFENTPLEEIDLSNINFLKLTTMESMFKNSTLEEINLSNINLPQLINMGSMFKNTSLKMIDLSKINLPEVTTMASMFENTPLEKIDLSNQNVPKLNNMASMFENCSELLHVNLNNFIISNEINMENILKGCEKLINLEVIGFNFNNIKASNSLFGALPNLGYLNIKDAKFIDDIRQQFKTIIFAKNETVICLNDDYLGQEENKNPFCKYRCCNYLLDAEICESFNFIKVKYNESTNYKEGFGNDARKGIVQYVKKGDKVYKPSTGFTIENSDIELEIYFSEGVISLKDMFNSEKDPNTEKIVSIDFTNFNTSNLMYMNSLFKGCGKLEKIDFSNLDTSLVIDMSNLFNGCMSLSSIDLSKFNTETVTNMNSMFANCSSLTYIELANFKISNVIDMGSMFANCDSLTYINLSNFNTESVTNMNSMFARCSSLTYINLSSFNTESVTDMNSMFANCSSLTYINLFNFNTSNVNDMGSMFEGCEQLEIANLFYFNTSLVTDMSKMFYKCKNLVFIDISNFNLQSVTNSDDMFNSVFEKSIYVDLYGVKDPKDIITYSGLNKMKNLNVCQKENLIINENTKIACCNFDVLSKKCMADTSNLLKIIFESDVNYANGFKNDIRNNIYYILDKVQNKIFQPSENLTFIAGNLYDIYLKSPIQKLDNFFNSEQDPNLKQIKSIGVIFPNSSSVVSLESMFYGCSSLESVYFLDIDTSSVTQFTSMFRECSSLISVDLTLFDTSSIENMKQMFYKCKSLEYVDLSSFDTSLVTTMEKMFAECTSLEYLDLSYFDTSFTENMNNMFYGDIKLKVLDISSFNTGKISSFNKIRSIFNKVQNLKYINLYNVRDTKNYFKDTFLKNIENLTICQKEDIGIIKNNSQCNCCFYDIQANKCEAYNYMFIYYDKHVTYEAGFNSIEDSEIEYDNFRNGNYFLINNDYFNKINETSKLVVKKGSKLGIYFTSKITTLESYFNADIDKNTKYIKKVILSHLDMNSVESTSKMFYKCSNLKSVEFFNKEASSLTNMNSMFYQCVSLEEVDISYFNTSLVKDMGNMFEGCSKLQILDLSSFDVSSVNNAEQMFSGCENLKYLDITNFNLESIDNIKGIFNGITNLQYLNLYNAKKIFNKNLENEELDSFKDLLVCQKEKIISKNINGECCYHNTTACESLNFIIIYFEKETIYETGFIYDNNGNKIRGEEIDFIINGKHSVKYKGTDKLFIRKGKKIEIYFKPGITILDNYFSSSKDPNMENIVSIDLSHFNTSSVTNMASMFSGCHSLKSIDLYNIDTSSVEDMNKMFNDCKQLETLDLSFFDTSLVTNMDSMFNGCESLIYLDISNFNLEKITKFNSVFTGADNLQYVNLYYVNNSYEYISNSELNDLDGVTICQKEYLVTKVNANYNCCYYDTEKRECKNNNFAVIYFGQEVEYNNGFYNNNRKGKIDFIINRDRNSPLSENDKFIVKKGSKIEVYFYSNLTTLESFFGNVDGDSNMEYAISIDLSNLKTSSVISMAKMFYMCKSLKSIDLSNIDTSSVKDMNHMFFNCSSLESIDLSYFETSLVENMGYMFAFCGLLKIIDLSYFNTPKLTNIDHLFNGCDSLQLLDISHFNLEAINSANDIFGNLGNLKYINIYNIQDSKGKLKKSETNLKGLNLTVCQKENIITEGTDYRCCYYNIETKECLNYNYITIFFGDKAIYNNGFEKDEDNITFREGIDFIINGDEHNKKLTGKDKIYLRRGSKLEIYFSNDSLSLNDYFSAAKDVNMKNLVSVYLSNLNSTVSNNLDNLFYGCESLKSVVDLNEIKVSPIVNMSYMFYNCTSLEFIDLSAFNTSSVENMISIFENCKSLKYLDISNFDLGNLKDDNNIKNMLQNVDNLKYINVYNIQDPNKLLLNYKLPKKFLQNIPIVCQKEDNKIISNDNITTKCCYYEMNNDKCEDTNFITLYYGEDVEYESYENNCRKETLGYVINSDHNTKISFSSHFKIKKGHKLEIYFSSPLESLEEYFSPSCDSNMKKIISVDLSNFDTSKLTNMKSAFENCELLETVDFNKFKGTSIINMNFLFSNCVELKSIDFSHLDPSSVVYMNSMFSGCVSLYSIKFSSSKATSLVNLEEMFYKCSSLRSIDLSMFIITSATNMDYMFSGCSSLKYLDISNFKMETVTNANSMFKGIINLKYINLLKTKDYNDYISKSELNNLDNLTVCQTEQILTKDYMIHQCCKYNITIEKCEKTNYIEIYYGEDVFYEKGGFKNCGRDNISYIIIGDNSINYTDKVDLDIKKNIKVEIHFDNKLESLSNFFCSDDENTKHIVSIDLSYLDTSKLKDISSMFSGCSSLKTINLEYFNTSLVTNMSSLFRGCLQLESIDLSNLETSSVNDMSKMFYGCSKLTSIDLLSFDTFSVVDISSMFDGCSSIESLDLSNFKTSQVTNFDSIFSNCTNLKVLDISHFEINVTKIENMFKNVDNLRYINLDHIVDTGKILNSSVSKNKNINVCQNVNKRIVQYENMIERCCYYNILTDKCDNSNYIVVKFGESTIYENGFEYSFLEPENVREGKIDFIIYKNKKYSPTDELNIEADSEIEIYLKNITSLEKFFLFENDVNVENIISVDFSHLDASKITDISELFRGCENLLSVDFSNFNSSSLTKMDFLFYGCESITSVNLSYFNTSLVTDMTSLFEGCKSLGYIYLSNLNTSKVENMDFMFSECQSLVSLDLSYFKTTSLTSVQKMFYKCRNLKVLDISNFQLDNIQNSENMFDKVGNLKYINLYYVEDNKEIIKNSGISSINNLTVCEKEDKIIPNNNIERKCCYFSIPNNKCESDNYIIIYYGKESEYKNGFENKYRGDVSFIINEDYINILTKDKSFKVNAGCKIELYFNSQIKTLESFFDYDHDINIGNIKSIDLSHFNSSQITDMSKAFLGCATLESINFDKLSFSNATNMNKMFFGCNSLGSIDLTHFDVSQVKYMSYMFYGCNSLESINLTHFEVSQVTDMSYMFYGCSSLKSINTTYLDISSVTKMNHMFYRCSSLESIDFSFYQTSPLTNLEQMFYDCENLTSVNLSKFDTSLVTSMKEMFYGCNKLVYIDVSNFNMSKCESYSKMFQGIDFVIYINIFNLTDDKIFYKVFGKTKKTIFVCKNEEIIKNKKAIYCCDFNFEFNKCENMPTTIVTTFLRESTFLNQQSTINSIFTDTTILSDEKQVTTYSSENNNYIETTFVKEKTETIVKTTLIQEQTEGFTDFISDINKEPTTFISSDTTKLESTIFVEKAESTSNHIKDTTNALEKPFTTYNIETTQIYDLPSTNLFIDTTSLNKDNTIATSKNTNQPVSTNDNEVPLSYIREPSTINKETELKTNSFTNSLTVLIEETTYSIAKTSNIIPSTSIVNEKKYIQTTSLPKETTSIPTITSIENQQFTSNLYSTTKEEINLNTIYTDEKTTSEIEKVRTSIPTTQSNIDSTGPTTSKLDTTQTNFDTKTYTTYKPDLELTTTINEPSTSEIKQNPITSELKQELSSSEIKQEPITSELKQELSTSEIKQEPITSELKQEPSTSEPKQEPSTSELKQEPSTSEPKQDPSTSEPKKEPSTSEPKQEPSTSEPKQESSNSEPKQEPTTSIPKQEPATSEWKQEPSTSELKITTSELNQEPTTSELKQEPTTSKAKQESTSSEAKPEFSTSEPKLESTNSEPKLEPTTFEQKQEPTTSKPESVTTTSEPEISPTTSETEKSPITSGARTTVIPIVTTSINNKNTESISTTIPNHINLTSIASIEIKPPTTIVDDKIKTTMITNYGSAYAILLSFSDFIKYNTYCTFYVHFLSISGFIFAPSLKIRVFLINNRILRFLESQESFCEKVNDDLINADYLCNVASDTTTVSRIEIEPEFNFTSQDIKIIGISPIAHTLMENVQNATEEYNDLLSSNIYILDHCNITPNKKNNTFNISGIINEQKKVLEKTDLILKVNIEIEKETKEAEVNCTIVEINGINYTLKCIGEKNILYNLQTAISTIDNCLLIVNFDENSTHEILFSSNSYKFGKEDTNGMKTGVIIAIILLSLIVLAVVITAFVFLRRKKKTRKNNAHDSTVVELSV